MSDTKSPSTTDLVGYWWLSYRTSNQISVSIDALGDVNFRRGIGDDGITIPLEDLEMILAAYHGRTQ